MVLGLKRCRFVCWKVLCAESKDVENVIRCGGLAPTKASCIKNVLRCLRERRGELCLEYLRDLSIDEIKAEISLVPKCFSRKPSHLFSCRRWFLVTASERKKKKKLMVALPMPQDTVVVELRPRDADESMVDLGMKVVKRREPLRAVTMAKVVASGQQSDNTGILIRLLEMPPPNVGDASGPRRHQTLEMPPLPDLATTGLVLLRSASVVVACRYNCCQVSFVNLLPKKENLCLYGFPSEHWEVNLPAEEVPPSFQSQL
ncbi:hypothetical protein JHK84_052649 [Glycine max]|nr:hypothetical protein JHK85_053470 [Glycine max]KAG5082611.1 hypothetical protein JHK84_052649 [Glycine max]